METLSYLYTSKAEIERVFSQVGVSLRVDDFTTAASLADFWTDIIAEATDIINQYAEMFYSPSDMVNSYWVRTRCKWIGAYLLSQRRGNPALFLQRYQEIIEDLERIMEGTLIIPRLPTREEVTPSVSNQVVDDRFRIRKLRTHPEISVGKTTSRQDPSILPPYVDEY